MSRAFVKEMDVIAPDAPPELKVGDGLNPVTRAGLARMAGMIAALENEMARERDEVARNRIARDLRYWQAQAASATVMPPPDGDEVGFGSRVTLSRNGRIQTIEIVGEGEADLRHGRINWQAPLASAVIGARQGDTLLMDERDPPEEITIVAVDNHQP